MSKRPKTDAASSSLSFLFPLLLHPIFGHLLSTTEEHTVPLVGAVEGSEWLAWKPQLSRVWQLQSILAAGRPPNLTELTTYPMKAKKCHFNMPNRTTKQDTNRKMLIAVCKEMPIILRDTGQSFFVSTKSDNLYHFREMTDCKRVCAYYICPPISW